MNADLIHHEVLALMAQHAAIAPRGFDSIRARAHIHNQIDARLDEWLHLAAEPATA